VVFVKAGDQRSYSGPVEQISALRHNHHWRIAVWSLRVGYLALVICLVGPVVNHAGATPWVLFAGAALWIGAAAVTLAEVLWARAALGVARPWFWSLRFLLIRDTVRHLK